MFLGNCSKKMFLGNQRKKATFKWHTQNFEESQKVLKSTEPAKVTKLGSLNMDRQLKFHHA